MRFRLSNGEDGIYIQRCCVSAGLPGMLFSLLDYETDTGLVSDIHDTLTSIVQTMAADNLQSWLALCREVLTDQDAAAAGAKDELGSGERKVADGDTGDEDEDEDKDEDDDAEFTFGDDPEVGIIFGHSGSGPWNYDRLHILIQCSVPTLWQFYETSRIFMGNERILRVAKRWCHFL